MCTVWKFLLGFSLIHVIFNWGHTTRIRWPDFSLSESQICVTSREYMVAGSCQMGYGLRLVGYGLRLCGLRVTGSVFDSVGSVFHSFAIAVKSKFRYFCNLPGRGSCWYTVYTQKTRVSVYLFCFKFGQSFLGKCSPLGDGCHPSLLLGGNRLPACPALWSPGWKPAPRKLLATLPDTYYV